MAHEVFDRDEEVKGSSDRSFGLVLGGFFLIVALAPLLRSPFLQDAIRWWALAISVAFLGLALISPRLLAPLNRLWTRFGLLLHQVVSPIILAAMFYVAVMPIGLLLRLFGKDVLSLRRDDAAASYWIERTPPGPDPATMRKQF